MKTVVRLLALFIVAQAIGIVVASGLLAGGAVSIAGGTYTLEDAFFMVVGFAFAVLLLLAIMRLYKGELLYKIMEFVILSSAGFVVFYGIGVYVGYGTYESVALALALALAKFIEPRVRNITAVISSAGIAVMFAMFLSLTEAVIFVIIMSVYDYVAVFITRHMVTMATEFGKRQLSFSISSQEKVMRKVKVADAKGVKRTVIEEKIERLELGTGDIALPLAFALVVFKTAVPHGFGPAVASFIIISVFSAMALAIVLFYVRKRRLFLPALPPIMLGTVVGCMIAYVSGILII